MIENENNFNIQWAVFKFTPINLWNVPKQYRDFQNNTHMPASEWMFYELPDNAKTGNRLPSFGPPHHEAKIFSR